MSCQGNPMGTWQRKILYNSLRRSQARREICFNRKEKISNGQKFRCRASRGERFCAGGPCLPSISVLFLCDTDFRIFYPFHVACAKYQKEHTGGWRLAPASLSEQTVEQLSSTVVTISCRKIEEEWDQVGSLQILQHGLECWVCRGALSTKPVPSADFSRISPQWERIKQGFYLSNKQKHEQGEYCQQSFLPSITSLYKHCPQDPSAFLSPKSWGALQSCCFPGNRWYSHFSILIYSIKIWERE